MHIPQKCQYAIRAVYELSKRQGQGPATISEIATRQAIPSRFLEVILVQLKQGGFVESKRGKNGGYTLVHRPEDLSVGDIMRFMQVSMDPVDCYKSTSKKRCRFYKECVFLPMWERVSKAISEVYDTTFFQDLVDQEKVRSEAQPAMYSI